MRTLWYGLGIATGLLMGAGWQIRKGPRDNPELARMEREDQADRRGTIDWAKVSPRDAERRRRTLALYRAGRTVTGADFVHAAMILQHGAGDDGLLAHELCVAALAKGGLSAGDRGLAVWLAAAAEDRWLDGIGRRQRFGTQYKSVVGPDGEPGKMALVPVEAPGVTDAHRRVMGCPTLAEAKARASKSD